MVLCLSILVLASLESARAYCNKYKCGILSNYCIYTSNGVTTLDDTFCPSGQYCIPYYDDYGDMYGYCGSREYTNRLPGAICTYDSDCYSDSCVNNVCKGYESGETCSESEECDIGLYCDLTGDVNVCASIKGEGDECDDYWECPFGYGCNYGICTEFFTIATGSSTEVYCDSYYSSFCKSGNCAYKDGIYACIEAFTYDDGGDILECSSNLDCGATSGSYTW